jgi:glutamate carboxypeptidase
VLIESGSANAAGLAKMADYVGQRLQALGARTERIAVRAAAGHARQGTFSGTGTKSSC